MSRKEWLQRKTLQKKKENAAKGTNKITYLFKAQVSNETMWVF